MTLITADLRESKVTTEGVFKDRDLFNNLSVKRGNEKTAGSRTAGTPAEAQLEARAARTPTEALAGTKTVGL